MTIEEAAPHSGGGRQQLWNRQYCFLFVINLLVALTVYMTNTFMSRYLENLNINAALSGTILGVMSIASMLIRPLSGWVCDRFSRKLLLILCNGIIAAVLVGYGFARTAAVFYLLRALHGVAFGLTTTITMAFVADYIPRNRVGEGMGYFGLGQSVAAAAGPWLGLSLANRFGGAAVFFAAGAAVLAGAGIACLIRAEPKAVAAPETELKKLKLSQLKLSGFIAKETLPFAAITIALSAANGIETSYIASYAGSLGIENIGWYFTASATALFGARLLMGKITDKKGFAWVLYPGTLLVIIALFILSLVPSGNAVLLFAAAAVIKACGVGALQPGIQAMCVGAVPPERRGAASGTYYICADLGQGMSTITAGRILSEVGYAPMFGLFTLPLMLVLAACLSIKVIIPKIKIMRGV